MQRKLAAAGLGRFHPAVASWFGTALGAPTPCQTQAWEAVAAGRHTLIAAPTGSGKTLAGFLTAIDALVRDSRRAPLPDATRVVYVSPLKALGNDVHKNLEVPLAGIDRALAEAGEPGSGIRAMVRTGDTPDAAREAMRRQPPHILVTTPESLYILLTSEGGRAMLAGAGTVIVDEIHAVAGNKRGAHLALSLERLDALTGRPLTRIGLSATQRPIETVAHFLTGCGEAGRPHECTVVDTGHRRERDLALELPESPLEAVMSGEVWGEVYRRLCTLIEAHRTTLVFVNTRRMAERVARALTESLGEEHVTSHHGSLSRERRLAAEQRLKAGDLKVLVATASLELGIDVGDVDLVCQLGSTRSIATFLQRTGRSGHAVSGTPKARLFPLTRDELVECAAILDAVRRGELDRLHVPSHPLDVLAQQAVAMVAAEDWSEEALFATVRRAWPYRSLTGERWRALLAMLAGGFATRRGRRSAYLHRDVINGALRARRGARLTAMTSGGAIPDNADYDVVLEPHGTQLGTLNEDFAIESLPGDIFQLGNTSWRILRIERGAVRVEDAQGLPPNIPFWFGEAPGRTAELSESVCDLLGWLGRRLDGPGSRSGGGDGKDGARMSGIEAVGIGMVGDGTTEAGTDDTGMAGDGTVGTEAAGIGATGTGMAGDGTAGAGTDETGMAGAGMIGARTAGAGTVGDRTDKIGTAGIGTAGATTPEIRTQLARELAARTGIGVDAGAQIVDYLCAGHAALGALPDRDTVVLERFFDESGGMQLVIHARFGSRLNRAWGLALRKRFCRKFNFELQAAATEDAIVLSLGESHSFALDEVARYLSPETVRDVLTQALLDAPMFDVRWRWNANVSLAIPRFRGGSKVPPNIQRMQAEDLVAAVFPDQIACAENLSGPREIPDHPLVEQTIADALTEAMDVEGLEALVARLAGGEIRVVARDLTEPSPLAAEVLDARPYAFLDDAPLEERRTRAVSMRRALDPESAADVGRLDPEAIERVREEAWPEAATPDELHDALVVLGFATATEGVAGRLADSANTADAAPVRPANLADAARRIANGERPGWSACFDALVASGRATRFRPPRGGPVLWCAAERLASIESALGDRACRPAARAPRGASRRARTRRRRWPSCCARGSDASARSPRPASPAISGSPRSTWKSRSSPWKRKAACCAGGSRKAPPPSNGVTGACSRASTATPSAGCGARSSRRRARSSCASCSTGSRCGPTTGGRATRRWPPSPRSWKGSRRPPRPGRRRSCPPGSRTSPRRCWIASASPVGPRGRGRLRRTARPRAGRSGRSARPRSPCSPAATRPCGSRRPRAKPGERRGRPPDPVRRRPYGPDDPTPETGPNHRRRRPSARAMPPCLETPAPRPHRLPAAPDTRIPGSGVSRGDTGVPPASLSPGARNALSYLRTRGASFFDDLLAGTGARAPDAAAALGELITHGLVSADGFAGLRAFTGASARRLHAVAEAGRWACVLRRAGGAATAAGPEMEGVGEDGAETIARTLLRRYGIVFKTLLARESLTVPWRDLLRVLRRLEARGEIRGGRFVAGFTGEQYALPEAVETLRRVRRAPADGAIVALSAADPLNLTGIVTLGDRIPATASTRIAFRDGAPVATLTGARKFDSLESQAPEQEWAVRNALLRRRMPTLSARPA